MSVSVPAPQPRKLLSARRLTLLASVAAIGATVLFAGPGFDPRTVVPTTYARAAESMRPASFADVVERVKPAVFSVRVKVGAAASEPMQFDEDENGGGRPAPGTPLDRFFRQFGGPEGQGQRGPRRNFTMAQGSGFFISADGYAVTNNHVIANAKSVEITTDDGKSYSAKVVGSDSKTDVALLKVDGRSDFPYVRFAETSPRIGDWVLAVGNPFGLGGTVTAGIVSARGRDIGNGPYDDFIQIDAAVNKGNSGGPTFDVDGNVIGVNTAIFSPTGGSVGIGFAVPADTVKTVVVQLREKGAVTRGWIGVQIQTVTADIAESLGLKQAQGALVADPQPDGPAAKAGIRSGDVITAVDGEAVKDARELARRIGAMAPGTAIKLTIVRGSAESTVALTLGRLPPERQARADTEERETPAAAASLPRLGLTLAPGGTSAGGVLVTNVDPDGPAAEHGFRRGDVILDVGGRTVATPADIRKALTEARADGKKSVLFRVKSNEGLKFVALPLSRA